MRKKFIGGNWKMNLDGSEAEALAKAMAQQSATAADVDIAVFPPFVYLERVAKVLAGSKVQLGAQDVYFESKGAFTGEISVGMLKDVGCSCVLVGHSERRHVLMESDELINKKLHAALAGGLDVVLCVGEKLEQREAGQTNDINKTQLINGLKGVSAEQMSKITIAYEPVWAIGTGKTASKEQAQEVHAFVRSVLTAIFDGGIAEQVRIQYGGSVKPANAAELLGQKDVDGALVGGASLNADDFMAIINAG